MSSTPGSPDTPAIVTTPDGPFLMRHDVVLRTATDLRSERGEPMTWAFGAPIDVADHVDDGMVALCRCGQSDDKPFCDGSHVDAEWDPSDAPQPDENYLDRARRKSAPSGVAYELADDTKLCTHAGFCATEKRSVWQMLPATEETAVLGTVIRMVEKCPSGRITNVLDGNAVEQRLPQEVSVTPNGPLWVTGALSITTAAGNELENRNRVTLCRCGASGNKPLCDGSHQDIGFAD